MAVHQLSLSLIILIAASSMKGTSAVLCNEDNSCRCTLDDGTNRFFDLSGISSTDGPFFQVGAPGRQDYYDPCQPFTINDSGGVCNGVAGCHNELDGQDQTFSNIAKHDRVVFDYNENGGNLVLNYDNGDGQNFITLEVVLICSSGNDVLEVDPYTPISYRYLLVSPHSCLQSPGPTTLPGPITIGPGSTTDSGGSGKDGLSAGSILCILFSVSVFVYLVGGFIFTALVQKKSGREAIPNYSFWIEVPGLIKEGATFSTSCVSSKLSSSHETLPGDNQDGADAFAGDGAGGGDSSKQSAYDKI